MRTQDCPNVDTVFWKRSRNDSLIPSDNFNIVCVVVTNCSVGDSRSIE